MTLVMEYASGGELFDYINSQSDAGSSDDHDSGNLGGLREGEARQFFSHLVSAVQYLHEVCIPAHILVWHSVQPLLFYCKFMLIQSYQASLSYVI